MSGNAYRCFECGHVEPVDVVEGGGRDKQQWISISPISLVLLYLGAMPIPDEAPFCSPDCLIRAMQKVKRL